MKQISKDYPRPQFVRDNYQILNGTWDFQFDDHDAGLAQNWKDGIPTGQTILVPFSYETKLSGIEDKTAHTVVWYQKEEEFPHEEGQRVRLWLEGCDYHTILWVNGVHIGEHTGGYSRFGFDITDALADGKARIVIRVYDPFESDTARGKQRWAKESYGCWYEQTTGIWKTVWSETVSASSLEHVKISPDFDRREVAMTYTLAGCVDGLELETLITIAGRTVCSDRTAVCGKSFSRTYDLQGGGCTWNVEDWSPEQPNLYEVEFRLYKDGILADKVDSYFGLRKISYENGSIRLNNSDIYLKMVLDQGYWVESGLTPPDDDALLRDIELMKKMGFNGVRKHQKIEDERFLYWCDVKGLMVWSEMAAFYKFTDEAVKNFVAEWQDILRQNYNHPSIIAWVPFNESWGVPNIMSEKPQQMFTESIYYLTKAYDPRRPVVCNDGWEHTISDIITLHDYDYDGENMLRRYGRDITPVLENRVSAGQFKATFANGYAYRGQPIIISEYGGVAYSDAEGWGYHDRAKSEEEFLERTAQLTAAVRQMPAVCGYCITQLTDVQQEVNGLLYGSREPKADISKINAIFSR